MKAGKTQSFYIVYDGPALENSEIDVRQLAPALHAIGDLFEAASCAIYGNSLRTQVRVKGSFKTGCFGIDFNFVYSLADALAGLFTSQYIDAALNLAELIGLGTACTEKGRTSLIALLQKLRGREITKVIDNQDGTVRIEVTDDTYQVEKAVLDLLRNLEVRKALDATISEPLRTEGITSFGYGPNSAQISTISQSESAFFAAPPLGEEVLGESTYETTIKVINVAFQEDNLWRISEGGETLHARIEDKDFLSDVHNNSRAFAKDDLFRVRLRKRQTLGEKGRVRTETAIEKVLDHRSAARQIHLPLENANNTASLPTE